MNILLALCFVGFAVFSVVQLIMTVFQKPRLLHLKRSGLGLLGAFLCLIGGAVISFDSDVVSVSDTSTGTTVEPSGDIQEGSSATQNKVAPAAPTVAALDTVPALNAQTGNPRPRPRPADHADKVPETEAPRKNAENTTEILPGQWARAFCKMVDRTGLTSSPCEVSLWNSEIIISIDMIASEARALCPDLVKMMKGQGATFDPGWTLQIRSPYSGDQSIAFCRIS